MWALSPSTLWRAQHEGDRLRVAGTTQAQEEEKQEVLRGSFGGLLSAMSAIIIKVWINIFFYTSFFDLPPWPFLNFCVWEPESAFWWL